eukprot:CAMPEP_0172546076 /NCGR_PEP_ID=MMETSP1067-20121228/15897_1 /TAXON_ID=265564 ORGANISM="Thalassiosira punctigera, Strain Tpunct2005C2" /NCGR_SAMPLE_ID=MMETSP1067 /ASSEMBLY_ACC=CAM_ASM_000444 /LENGTH=514 /DNA_ID=CAMNT_0013332947 /DNA_START=78 /DNA_END=1625 /DNA_ORIENTATION=+
MAQRSPADEKDGAPARREKQGASAHAREKRDDDFDRDMLYRAIADTGRWAYGTVSVEAWVFSEQTGKLIRPERAFWFDPVVVHDGADNEALMRLVDHEREDFVRPDPLAPGIGLAGALWSELSHRNAFPAMNMQRHLSGRGAGVAQDGMNNVISLSRNVVWREVEPISNDPDQPYNLRLQLAVEAGIGLAAGVQFQFRGTKGLVIYMARGTTDVDKLKSVNNERYLLSAADVIGSIVAMRGPRHVCLEERRAEREAVRRRLKAKMVAFANIGGCFLHKNMHEGATPASSVKPQPATAHSKPSSSISGSKQQIGAPSGGSFKSKLRMIVRKWMGANNAPPPPMITSECIWTFCGCFLTLLMLLNFSNAISKRKPDYSLVLGPFGALMTLQYSLAAAPASQPRNAIIGQAIAIAVAMGSTYVPIETNLRRSLGTAIAITAMARLGVTHPPAGAAALIFTGGKESWGNMGIMLAGNVLAIVFATVINDMNVKRQYPTFWGFGHWRKMFFPAPKKNVE